MLRDLVWLEEEEKEAWCGCEVQLRGWGVDQVGTLRWSGLGPAGLWGPLLPTRPRAVGQRVREGEKGQESSADIFFFFLQVACTVFSNQGSNLCPLH